jgi:hypothetical protein
MFQYLSSDSSQSPDIATLLDKLASQPNGLENGLKLIALLMPKPEPQPTPEDSEPYSLNCDRDADWSETRALITRLTSRV